MPNKDLRMLAGAAETLVIGVTLAVPQSVQLGVYSPER